MSKEIFAGGERDRHGVAAAVISSRDMVGWRWKDFSRDLPNFWIGQKLWMFWFDRNEDKEAGINFDLSRICEICNFVNISSVVRKEF